MSFFMHYLPLFWLLLSVIGLLLDSYVFPHKGALPFSIASLSIGILLIINLIPSSDLILQIIIGSIITIFCWLLLKEQEKKIKKKRNFPFSFASHSIIGKVALVGNDDIIRDLYGVVHFEGKLYTARISDDASECVVLKKGQEVEIVSMNGTILKVIPRQAALASKEDLMSTTMPDQS